MSVPPPHHLVQIGHTVGNPDLAKLQGNGAWAMIRHAIRQSKRLIYLEEQYFWSQHAAVELAAALPRLHKVIVILPPDDKMPPAGGGAARYLAMKALAQKAGADAHKVNFYVLKGSYHSYVHSKTWIFDDEFAVTGSANCNDRGYYYDSEVIGGVADPHWSAPAGPREGKWYRLEGPVVRASWRSHGRALRPARF